MSCVNLKNDLQKIIAKVNELPSNFEAFNKKDVSNSLLQYVIFIEEVEQKIEKETLELKDVKEELKIIRKYLFLLNQNM